MMQRALILRWIVLLCLLLLSKSTLTAQETYSTLAPGVAYRHDVRADGPLSIHVIRIDRNRSDLEFHASLGQGTVFGLEPLDGMVGRTESILHLPAMAAINGDFFLIQPGPYQGDPRGIQIIEGELVSGPTKNAFWVTADGCPHMGPVNSKLKALWSNGKNEADGKTEVDIGLNENRADNAVVLYTPTLGLRADATPNEVVGTRTHGGKELVLERVEGQPWLPLAVGTTYTAKVSEIRDGGDTPLSPNRMILSIGPEKFSTLPPISLGNTLQLSIQTEPDLQGVNTAVGAGRILVQDGELADVGPANQPRHPRSMIGWNRQAIFLIVVDGRQPELSVGMSYPEMAQLAKQYECTDAIELDGGGSSTLWATGKIWNSPSDGKPRAIANGLIVFRRDPP
jgi:exopolysaccharide biosynthesis protein